MLLVREVAVRVHGYVVLERGVRRRYMHIRAHLLAVKRKGEARVRGGPGDGVGKNIVDVHSGPTELCSDKEGLHVSCAMCRVVPCSSEDVVRVELDEAPAARRALLPRCRWGVRGHDTRHAVSRLVINSSVDRGCGCAGCECCGQEKGKEEPASEAEGETETMSASRFNHPATRPTFSYKFCRCS